MTCLQCGKEFEPLRSHRKYCSDACRLKAFAQKRKRCPKCGYVFGKEQDQE